MAEVEEAAFKVIDCDVNRILSRTRNWISSTRIVTEDHFLEYRFDYDLNSLMTYLKKGWYSYIYWES